MKDTSRYGKDLYGEYSLDKLLEKLVTVDGIKWIRVHYFYPEAITDSLIDTMAKYDKICNYIDMPVQHGNNEILRRMARRTTQEQMVERINKIREWVLSHIHRKKILLRLIFRIRLMRKSRKNVLTDL